MEFSQAFVPTLDSTRYQYLLEMVTTQKKSLLICGDAGTTKTATIGNFILSKLTADPESFQGKNINFSFQTTHNLFQFTVESVVEKRQGKTYGPTGGKKMFVFIDDISMPEVNDWGDQPTNEIVRQLLDSGGMYDLRNRVVRNSSLICSTMPRWRTLAAARMTCRIGSSAAL
jgi:dynein heavy chain